MYVYVCVPLICYLSLPLLRVIAVTVVVVVVVVSLRVRSSVSLFGGSEIFASRDYCCV